ncbi:MAG: hypothetical protein WC120_05365 [Parcubacteria group bacterium]|jgi:hypothetical protein
MDPTTETSPKAGELPPETAVLDLGDIAEPEGETGEGEDGAESGEGEDPAGETPPEPQEPSWHESFEKSGDLNVLPGDHGRKVRRAMTELGLLRKKIEALESRGQTSARPERADTGTADGPPPVDRSSEEAYDASMLARQEWAANRAAEKRISALQAEMQAQTQTTQLRADDQARTAWVQSQPDCTPDVINIIKELGGYEIPWEEKTEEQQFWATQYWNNHGLKLLYKEAVSRVGGKTRTAQENKRRAQIPASVTPRPNGSGTARSTTPVNRFRGKSMDEFFDMIDGDIQGGAG